MTHYRVKKRVDFEMNDRKLPSVYILFIVEHHTGASLVAQMVKHSPPRQETQVGSLVREDPLQKEMATHSSILA